MLIRWWRRSTDRDTLTGLLNRRGLSLLAKAHRGGSHGVGLLIDIDRFKWLNDQLGHTRGDQVLIELARRFQAAWPAPATVFRLGGDEFMVWMPEATSALGLAAAERGLAAARQPMPLEGAPDLHVTVSIGCATLDGQGVDELLRRCDMALYAAKGGGRDQVHVYGPHTAPQLDDQSQLPRLVDSLREANRTLYEEARTDALTRLPNRRALDEALRQYTPRDAAIAFIDIDHFGAYNHAHGDAAGDQALCAVAGALRAAAREGDRVFRKGGEEFVVLLGGIDASSATRVAERLRVAVQALGIANQGQPGAPVLSVTVGVATADDECAAPDVLRAASALVMTAKTQGRRNGVHVTHLPSQNGSQTAESAK